jgi:hypothetical protein
MGRRIHDISPHAWGQSEKFFPFQTSNYCSQNSQKPEASATTWSTRIGELINPWKKAIPPDVENCRIVLAFDAVAFRPVITIFEDGRVDGLKTMDRLDSSDLFSQFVSGPVEFVSFVKDYWNDAYSALFAFQIQPIRPDFPCSIIHTMSATSGKATQEVVGLLLALKDKLSYEFGFRVMGLAFDADSACSGLHEEFRKLWKPRIEIAPHIPLDLEPRFIICDRFHLMKRIIYRWVSSVVSIGFRKDAQLSFSTKRIQEWTIVPPLVFVNSLVTKMHDSLPLRLFSRRRCFQGSSSRTLTRTRPDAMVHAHCRFDSPTDVDCHELRFA